MKLQMSDQMIKPDQTPILVDESPREQPRINIKNSNIGGSNFLNGDTGGDQKCQLSDLKSKSNYVLPSISDVIENFSKSRHDEVMKEESYDGLEKQTLYNFLSVSNQSHRHIEVVR